MSAKRMSQREAKRWRKRALDAEDVLFRQKRHYWKDWPSSVVIGRIVSSDKVLGAVKTARQLEHGVVAVAQENEIVFFAVKL